MACLVGTDVERAAALIREGGVVAFATETVYGLGANAFDVDAVARVFEVKGRPRFDPLIVHLADPADLPRATTDIPERAERLAERFWPGPLTLVLPKSPEVPDLVTAGLPTVAVRVPDHPLATRLIARAGVPIAAPSANPFGRISPTTADHVREQLGMSIDYLLDGGPCRVGVESTVLALSGEHSTLLRPGGVTAEEIEAVIGPVASATPDDAAGSRPQASPGLLSRHYAPRTPLQIVGDATEISPGPQTGLLTLGAVPHPERFAAVEVLSEAGDLREAASRFFAALRRLDARGLERIMAVDFPDEGLGRALNDRLKRAASHPVRTASDPSEI
jgi:L-threonylcarbamoyladenylate synthase